MPENGTDSNLSLLNIAASWLKGQPFNNVMSVLMLAAICGIGYAVVYHMIPEERKAFESLVIRFEAQSERSEIQQSKQIDRICNSFDRALDRQQYRLAPGSQTVGSTKGD